MEKHIRFSGGTTSLWMEEKLPEFLELKKDIKAEVAIVGAGISGLTTAYFLAKAGKNVVILERGDLCRGQSSRTTAHLSNAFDDRYYEMKRLHGVEGIKKIAESHAWAINAIEKIIQQEEIDCEFARLPGYLFSESLFKNSALEKEYQAAHEAGLKNIQFVAEVPYMAKKYLKVLKFPDQAQFHIQKYLNGLAKACLEKGVKIYEYSPVIKLEEGKIHKLTIRNDLKVEAEYVVLATNSPLNRNIAIHTRQSPYRTYVIGIELNRKDLQPFLAWDMKHHYHYVRLNKKGGNILIVGGEDHRTGEASDMEKRYERLEIWTRHHFPDVGKILYRWSGQVMEPADGVAFIGENPGSKNVFVITGDSGNGMTHGTLGGRIIGDLIQGRENPWSKLYDPARFKIKAAPEYLWEAASANIKYKDWLSDDDLKTVEDLPQGEGAVFSHGLKKISVYRDEAGALHHRSAACPHLGCVVAWNTGEKSWDCPCHGSRFLATGEVIEGPALTDLSEI